MRHEKIVGHTLLAIADFSLHLISFLSLCLSLAYLMLSYRFPLEKKSILGSDYVLGSSVNSIWHFSFHLNGGL